MIERTIPTIRTIVAGIPANDILLEFLRIIYPGKCVSIKHVDHYIMKRTQQDYKSRRHQNKVGRTNNNARKRKTIKELREKPMQTKEIALKVLEKGD